MADDLQYRASGVGGLPKGSRQSLDEAEDFAAAAPDMAASAFEDEVIPELFGLTEGDELDAEIFAPTDFPNRPLTHGAPFGPGANSVYSPRLSDRAMLARIADRMLERKDSIPEEALVWAARALAEG